MSFLSYFRASSLQPLASGFTLVEMAIVLIIVGMIMLTVFPALTALRTGSQRSVTQSNLQALMTATAAYVQANGCLPCPMPANATGANFGLVGTPSHTSCGACAVPEGVVPFLSLGVTSGIAHDGWSHWITMRVDPALTGSGNFTIIAPPTKPCSCTQSGTSCTASSVVCTCSLINSVCTPSPANLSIQGMCEASGTGTGQLSKAASINVQTIGASSESAAVIFVSTGANGYGSYLANPLPLPNGLNGAQAPFPASYLGCAAGDYAECNTAVTTQFVDAPQVTGGAAAYDDVLAYAGRNALVSMLGNGSCQTVW